MATSLPSIATGIFALLLALPAAAAPFYSITTLPAATSVAGINELGQVAGYTGTAQGPRAYIWSAGVFTPLVTPGSASFATAINNQGNAAGYVSLADEQLRAIRYAGGTVSELDLFNGSNGYANAINDSGQIAGAYVLDGNGRAYLYSNGVATDLGTLGGSFSSANGINNAGQVVGFSSLDDSQPNLAHAFLYDNGALTDLGTMAGASLSEATAINDRGQITGHGWVQGNQHAFLYEAGVMRDLGTLGGRYSFAFDINNNGEIVGWSNEQGDLGTFAFLYDGSSMLNLNALIAPDSGWVLLEARGINDAGQIAAFGCRGEDCRGLLLQPAAAPIPEPAPWLLMLAGPALMGWRRISAACRYA